MSLETHRGTVSQEEKPRPRRGMRRVEVIESKGEKYFKKKEPVSSGKSRERLVK